MPTSNHSPDFVPMNSSSRGLWVRAPARSGERRAALARRAQAGGVAEAEGRPFCSNQGHAQAWPPQQLLIQGDRA